MNGNQTGKAFDPRAELLRSLCRLEAGVAAVRYAAATEDELAAEKAAARTPDVKASQRKRPSRKPFPEHLPRERVVIPASASCPCCGSAKLSKLGEDITERCLLAAIRQALRRWR
jgi:hypothetical protein